MKQYQFYQRPAFNEPVAIPSLKDSNIRLIIFRGRAFAKGYGAYWPVTRQAALQMLGLWGYAKSFIDCVWFDIRS